MKQSSNSLYELTKKQEIAQIVHVPCFSPKTKTWIAVIKKRHFVTWPGLTTSVISKHLPKAIETAMGHMMQQPLNAQSTQHEKEQQNKEEAEAQGKQVESKEVTKYIFLQAIEPTNKMHTNQL